MLDHRLDDIEALETLSPGADTRRIFLPSFTRAVEEYLRRTRRFH